MEKQSRTEELETETEAAEARFKVYEVGYHILPLLAEENVPAEVGNVKEMLESNGALFISDEFPKLRPLAYSITKQVDGRNQDFDQAYFGWVKFEMSPEKIEEVKKNFERNKNILRYILVETVRENTMTVPKQAFFRKEEDGEVVAEVKEELTPEDEAKVNQAIDDLVKE